MRNLMLMISLLFLFIACSELEQNSKLEMVLRELNADNHCNVTLNIDNNAREVTLTTECDVKTSAFFGKVLLDFYIKASAEKVMFSNYTIIDKTNTTILSLSKKEMRLISELNNSFKRDLVQLNKNELEGIYSRMDKPTIQNMSFKEIDSLVSPKIGSNSFEYRGLFVVEHNGTKFVIFSASGSSASVEISYGLNGEDIIYGLNILE